VVDDDPLVGETIGILLQRQGFDVTMADGGETGLAALESQTFDVMLVDIFMPHMRGFESIRIFHERAPRIPLIAMSGYAFAASASPSPDFLRMALELGATRCLRKPFTPDALLTTIKECLAGPESAPMKDKKETP
jgi:CheY-like chemotaxis protein